jgi:5'-deoxynucleotidase YfbR-like HD superfamily hydrolase
MNTSKNKRDIEKREINMKISEEVKLKVENLWDEISKVSQNNPAIIFKPDEKDIYLYEILVKLGKVVKERFGRGYSCRNDIVGVYGRRR